MAIRILSSENITGSFEVSGKVGIGTAPTSRNLSVFRSTAGSVANFLHYTDASNFAGLYIGVSQSSQTVSLNASGSSGGNFEMQCGNATALSLTSSNATFAGGITTTSATGIKIDTTGNAILELDGSSGSTEGIIIKHSGTEVSRISHSNSTSLVFSTGSSVTTALTLDSSQNATFAGQVSVGNYAIPSDHQFQIAHLGQSYARFALTNSQTGNGSSDGLIFQMENLNSIIKNQENGSLAFGTNGRETDLYINSSGSINIGSRRAALPSTFGYSSSYKVLILGSSGTNYQTDAVTLSLGVDVSGNPSGSYNGNGREIIIRNEGSFISPNASNNGYNTILSWNSSGQPYFNQNVGIGTTSPAAKLEVTTLRENGIRLSSSDLTAFPDELLSGIEFYSPDTSGGAGVKASIQVKYNDGDANSYMTFSTGTNAERMRIDSSGNVGIGTDDPDYELQVGDGTATETINIKAISTNPSRIFFSDNNAIGQGRIHYEHGGDYMNFWTDNTERMRITSGGDLNLKEGGNFYSGQLRNDLVNVPATSTTVLDFTGETAGIYIITVCRSGVSVAENLVCIVAWDGSGGNVLTTLTSSGFISPTFVGTSFRVSNGNNRNCHATAQPLSLS